MEHFATLTSSCHGPEAFDAFGEGAGFDGVAASTATGSAMPFPACVYRWRRWPHLLAVSPVRLRSSRTYLARRSSSRRRVLRCSGL